MGAVEARHLVRLELEGERVVDEEWLLIDRERWIRGVEAGPDGAIRAITDEDAESRCA